MSASVRLIGDEENDFWHSPVYVSFVRRWLGQPPDAPFVDPFDPRRPADDDRMNETFVDRAGLLNKLQDESDHADVILCGRMGSGRGTLAGMLAQSQQSQGVLFVQVRLDSAEAGQPIGSATSPSLQIWHNTFAQALFVAYWGAVFGVPQNRRRYLPALGSDVGWLHTLRQFYHRFLDQQPPLPEEPALAEWLQQRSPEIVYFNLLPGDQALARLIQLALAPAPPQPFRRIHWLIDATQVKRLTIWAVSGLKEAVQWLVERPEGERRFTILVQDDEAGNTVCSALPRASRIVLPEWTESDLHEMLGRRVSCLCPGQWDYSWEQMIAPELCTLLRDTLAEIDMKDLCQKLHIDWDNLPGSSRQDKTFELTEHLKRHRLTQQAFTCLRDMPTMQGNTRLLSGLDELERSKAAVWASGCTPLDPRAQREVPALIVAAAFECARRDKRWDAPYHALRLAREAVALCANPQRASVHGWITVEHIRSLIASYQRRLANDD